MTLSSVKKKIDTLDNSNRKYLCPQCFTIHYRNDVLFATGHYTSHCDTRQAALRYAFQTSDAFEKWCAVGVSEQMVSWTDRPEEDRKFRNGVIEAMRDANGNLLKKKVCPYCHSSVLLNTRVLFGWNNEAIDNSLPTQLLRCSGLEENEQSGQNESEALEYYRVKLNGTPLVLGVPQRLESATDNYARACQQRCCTNAHGAVVLLEVTRTGNELDTSSAENTFENFLQVCGYSGKPLEMPTIFLLQGASAVELSNEAHQFTRQIDLSVKSQCIFARDILYNSQMAMQAVTWMAQQFSNF